MVVFGAQAKRNRLYSEYKSSSIKFAEQILDEKNLHIQLVCNFVFMKVDCILEQGLEGEFLIIVK